MAAGKGKDVPTEIMSPDELKPLLLLAKRQPVTCVIGMTTDKRGMLLLDRRMKGRKLLSVAKAKARAEGVGLDTASLRYGRAEVAAASDSTTVHFTVNKAAPATLRPKLIVLLRQVHFQHCEISVDAALEDEAEEDGPEAIADAAPHPAAPSDGSDAAPGSSSGTPSDAAPGAEQLRARVRTLGARAKEVVSADRSKAGALNTAAAQIKQALDAGDIIGAGRAADALEHLLAPASPPNAAGMPGVPAREGPSSGSSEGLSDARPDTSHDAAGDVPSRTTILTASLSDLVRTIAPIKAADPATGATLTQMAI